MENPPCADHLRTGKPWSSRSRFVSLVKAWRRKKHDAPGEAQPFPLLIRIPAHAVHQQRGPRAHGTEGRRLVLQIHARAKGLPKPGMGNFDMDS